MKIRPVVAELLHADRRTDGYRDRYVELTAAFFNFIKTLKNSDFLPKEHYYFCLFNEDRACLCEVGTEVS